MLNTDTNVLTLYLLTFYTPSVYIFLNRIYNININNITKTIFLINITKHNIIRCGKSLIIIVLSAINCIYRVTVSSNYVYPMI